jgi:hypothetical protein
MLTQAPLPDGRVAIYLNGTLLGRARNQEHADDWCQRWTEQGCDLPGLAWRLASRLWPLCTPEQRRAYNAPEAVEQAA